MDQQLITRLLALHQLQDAIPQEVQKGYRNSTVPLFRPQQLPLNLICFKVEPGMRERIIRADAVASRLAPAGIPSRQAQAPLVELYSPQVIRYARLYSYLPGAPLPWGSYTMRQLKQIGQTMAQMHTAWRTWQSPPVLPDVSQECHALLRDMSRYLADIGVKNALKHKLTLTVAEPAFGKMYQAINAANELQPHHPLHMDFVRGNLLFDDGRLSGVIDFEKTGHGPALFDIARTLAFLLVDCRHKPAHAIVRYFLYSGYIKHGDGRVPVAARRLLIPLAQFFLLHDLYKFLRHNPYEALPANAHYLRTRDILLKSDIVTSNRH